MIAAVLESFDSPPKYGTFPDPTAGDGEALIRVRAAALSNLVKAQASGKHYSSGDSLPFVPGFDGVGTLPDGQRAYFFGPAAPYGAMAEWSPAAASRTILLPDGIDDVTAAALGNPGLATWGSLLGRARFRRGESVLINGATGVAGQQAIQAATHMGAHRVIATGRDESVLETLKLLGADETISLRQTPGALVEAFRQALTGIDVVLDYLWGESAECILTAAKGHGSPEGEPQIRYIQIGSISGDPITVKAEFLRSSGVELMGSGLGSLSAKAIVEALTAMFAAQAAGAGFKIDIEAIPLQQVEKAWNRVTQSGQRIAFTI